MARKTTNANIPSFIASVQSITDEQAKEWTSALVQQMEARKEYETTKDPGNANIQDTLKANLAQMSKVSFARACIAANIPADFVNRQVKAGTRYNVYAMKYCANIGVACAFDSVSAINKHASAIIHNALVAKKEGITFYHHYGLASVSDKLTLDAKLCRLFKRNNASQGTANGQGSPAMSALVTFGFWTKAKDDMNREYYTINENDFAEYLANRFAV
jgi:hypothetical protein